MVEKKTFKYEVLTASEHFTWLTKRSDLMGKFETEAIVPMILLTGTRHLQDSRGPATKRQSSLG